MYDRILLPVDGSEGATEAVRHVVDLAQTWDSAVTVCFVADTNQDSLTRIGGEIVDTLVDAGEEIVEEAAQPLAAAGVDYDTDVVQGGPPRTIVDYATRYDFDLIAMPTHARRGLSRRLLGSVTERVLRLAPMPVLTVRTTEPTRTTFPYERIVLPTDGSDTATAAVRHGLDLAATLDATPHVLSVASDSLLGLGSTLTGSDPADAAQSVVEEGAAAARERGLDSVVTAVERGSPPAAIRDYVDAHEIDAVVIGTTGQRGLERVFLGSVAETVVRTAPVPVVSVAGH